MGNHTIRQSIRYVRSIDGVRLACASSGSGPALVKAANWLTHLQYDLESPVWRHWIEFFAEHFHFIRYDERGCGMSQWEVPDVSLPRWIDDLTAVIDAANCHEPTTLLGISQGASACIAYAVRYPERVSHLILYGGYATGWARRGDPQGLRRFQAIVELVRLGWGTDTVAFARYSPRALLRAPVSSRSNGSMSFAVGRRRPTLLRISCWLARKSTFENCCRSCRCRR
jgi:pimeloyl-ACP methyl ester carboxylesterase